MTDEEQPNLDHPYREPPPRRALRRAQLVVYGPLAATMTVMVLAGFRMGMEANRCGGLTCSLGALFVLIWIAVGTTIILSGSRNVARWLLGCGMSLILGLTLGSWP